MSSRPLVGPPPEPNRKEHPYTGTVLFQGLRINVENLKGSVRSGVDPDGKAWRVAMPAHYGEFARTVGADGEPVDVFVGDNRHAHRVFVVHLQDPRTGEHDEDKVFLGFDNADDARDTFRAAYNRRDLQMGPVRTMSVSELQEWLADRSNRGARIDAGRLLSKGVPVFSSIFPDSLDLPDWIGALLFSDDMVKGAGHRYIRRVATGNPRRPWRYYYSVTGGKGAGHEDEFQVGSKFKVSHEGKAGHFEILGKTDSGDLRIRHDETGHETTVSPAVLRDMIHREHATAISAHREKLAGEIKSTTDSKARERLKAEASKYSHTAELAQPEKPNDSPPVRAPAGFATGTAANTDKAHDPASRDIAPGLRIVWNGAGPVPRHGTVKSVSNGKIMVAFDDGTEQQLYSGSMSDKYTGDGSRMYREADHPGAPFTAEQHAEMARRAKEHRARQEAETVSDTGSGMHTEKGNGSWSFTGHNYDPKTSTADIGRALKARLKAAGVKASVTTNDGWGRNVRLTVEHVPFRVFKPEYLAAYAKDPNAAQDEFRTRDSAWTPEALEFERRVKDVVESYGQARGDLHNGTYSPGASANIYWSDTFRAREIANPPPVGKVPELPVRPEGAPAAPQSPVEVEAPPQVAPKPETAREALTTAAADVVAAGPMAPVKFTGEVVAGQTKKTGAPVWSVPHEGMIPTAQWRAMADDAEKVKGYHLRGSGFTFRDPEHAKAFVAKWGDGSAQLQTPPPPAATAAPTPSATPAPRAPGPLATATARKPDVSRLRSAADTALKNAGEALGVDRKRDTYRRAQMAAGATAHAASEEAIAKTAHRIADAVEAGEAKALQNVRTMADVRTLKGALDQAKYETMRRSGESMGGDNLRDARPEDINRASFPHPVIHHGHARDLIAHVKGRPGTARAVAAVEAQIRHASGDKGFFLADTPEIRAHVETLVDSAKAKGVFGGKGYNVTGPRHGQPGYEEHIAKKAATSAVAEIADRSQAAKRLESMGITSTEKLKEALHEFHALQAGKRAADPIRAAQDALIGRKIPGYFPTPPKVQARVMSLAGVEPGMSVLEPSAGSGHLADAAKNAGGNVTTLEANGSLRDILKAKGHTVAGTDALTHTEQYDRVVMNPPFEDRQDAEHVQHAFEHNVKPGGRLVAIMGEGTFFGSDKKAVAFREWLAKNGGTSEKLPDGSFQGGDVSTGVSTRVVVLNKPQGGTQAPQGDALASAVHHEQAAGRMRSMARQETDPRRKERMQDVASLHTHAAYAHRVHAATRTEQNAAIAARHTRDAATAENILNAQGGTQAPATDSGEPTEAEFAESVARHGFRTAGDRDTIHFEPQVPTRPKRVTIKRGAEVVAYPVASAGIKGDPWTHATHGPVTGISHAGMNDGRWRGPRVQVGGSSYWMPVAGIYTPEEAAANGWKRPTPPPGPAAPKATLSAILESANKRNAPPGGWTDAHRVPEAAQSPQGAFSSAAPPSAAHTAMSGRIKRGDTPLEAKSWAIRTGMFRAEDIDAAHAALGGGVGNGKVEPVPEALQPPDSPHYAPNPNDDAAIAHARTQARVAVKAHADAANRAFLATQSSRVSRAQKRDLSDRSADARSRADAAHERLVFATRGVK